MTAPTSEAAIYQARTRTQQTRVIVGLTEPQWTASVTESFGSALSPTNLMYSDTMGGPPVTSGGELLIRGYGGPPFEWVKSRRGWFPNDITKAFSVTAVISFPVADPIYPQVFIVGSIEHQFGNEYECATVVQEGSAITTSHGPGTIGRIFVHGGGDIDVFDQAHDTSNHTLLVEWDPDAAGGAGAEMLTVKWDGSTVSETSDVPLLAAAPTYWQAGFIHPVQVEDREADPLVVVEGLGAVGSPVTLMKVGSVTVSEDGNGYESAAWPAWTSANAGGTTFDNSAIGERVVIDGVTWARFPNAYIKRMTCDGPSREGVPALSLTLSNLQSSGVDRFQDTDARKWVGRPVIVDTRMVRDDGTTFSAWKRLGMFTIHDYSLSATELQLTGVNRVLSRIDTPLAKSWSDETPDASAEGDDDAVNTGFTFTQIIENVVDLTDSLAGGPLATTDVQVYAPPTLPRALDNPGVSCQQWLLSLCDRLVQECWVKHTTSSTGRYGQLRVNLWTFGTGTSAWTFYGRGGASVSDIVGTGPTLSQTGRGPDQTFYRQDNPLPDDFVHSIIDLPLLAHFPVGQGNGKLEDSLSEQSSAGVHPQIAFPDSNGDDVFGGIANFRYKQEWQSLRRVKFDVINHDWMDVGDEIAISDPNGRGLTTAETWVISSVQYTWDNQNRLIGSISATTQSIRKASDVFA
jgi:hypothetical protein